MLSFAQVDPWCQTIGIECLTNVVPDLDLYCLQMSNNPFVTEIIFSQGSKSYIENTYLDYGMKKALSTY